MLNLYIGRCNGSALHYGFDSHHLPLIYFYLYNHIIMTDEQVQATGMLTEYQNQQKSAALYMADVVHWEVELQKTEAYQQLQKAKQALANADTLLKEKEK